MIQWPIGEEIRYDGTVHPLVAACPHYWMVPKDPKKHLKYRIKIRDWAWRHPHRQKLLCQMASEDVLWFVNTWCWLIEPRGDGQIPFNTWPHQDPWLAGLAHYSGWTDKKLQRDQCGRKSRAQGFSWGTAADFVRAFTFRKNCYQGIVSKDLDTADNPQNPNSLGWKIDYLIANLPQWMKPPDVAPGGVNRKVADHTWRNPKTGSYIMADAATGTGFRAGRLWRAFEDEASFFPVPQDGIFWENLRAVTNCRIMGSTPNGQDNKFYDVVHLPSTVLQFVVHWQDNPDHKKGLYTTDRGRLKVLDGEKIEGYTYRLDGRIRSPWYDAECDRAGGNMIEIARELDIDFGGSKSRPFPEASLDFARQFIREASRTGMFAFPESDPTATDDMSWIDGEGYHFKVWLPLDSSGTMPQDEYVVGCDIGAGTGGDGSSNSVLQIFNSKGEQVGEYYDNEISPERFSRLAVAVCYWLGHGIPSPYLIWEKNGPLGTQFGSEIKRLKYPNVYFMKDVERKNSKRTDKPGYHTQRTSAALLPLVAALNNKQLVVRSRELIRECGEYIHGPTDWEHPKARKSGLDHSLTGYNHGDRAIAASMCVIGLMDRRLLADKYLKTSQDKPLIPPKYSMAGRHREFALNRHRKLAAECIF